VPRVQTPVKEVTLAIVGVDLLAPIVKLKLMNAIRIRVKMAHSVW